MTTREKSNTIARIKRYKYVYLLTLPAFLTVLVFQYLPYLGITIAFKDFDIVKGFAGSPWVGLENFKQIFTVPEFSRAIINTLVYSAVLLFGTFPFPIILALLFNELFNMKFKKVVQTISYMPYFLSWISVIGLISAMLSLEGSVNQFLGKIISGYQATNPLMDSKYFLPIIFFANLWKNVGWSSVVFMAAIAGIDPSLYEATAVDGCGRFKQMLHITLPSIIPTAVLILIMNMGSLVSANFELVFGFQNAYTQNQTEVINTLVYRQGIVSGKYSLSTAFGLAQGLVSLLLVMISNAISKRAAGISLW